MFIITDQLRILTRRILWACSIQFQFTTLIGLPNPKDYQSDWDTSPLLRRILWIRPMIIGTICCMKKISSSDIAQVKEDPVGSGITYDMWRGDITRTNPSQFLVRLTSIRKLLCNEL